MKSSLYEIGNKISGPIFFNYVLWVLKNAEQKNIKTLYFLARDGFLLWKIAQILSKKLGMDIECRYLYCSRYSLRLPTYHFIEEKEAMELIFSNSNEITLKNIFVRTGFDKNDIEKVLNSLGINTDINEESSYQKVNSIKNKIFESAIYQKLLEEKSVNAYNNITAYFKQEKIFDYEHIGIVDSGWTGSMQRSLRQIIEHNGKNVKITGFYFGMFTKPKDIKDGEYCSWYFSKSENFWHKVLFCNNVLECMLSAPHAMTIGYQQLNNKWQPIYKKTENKAIFYKLVNEQIKGCIDYVNDNIQIKSSLNFNNSIALKDSFKILSKFMVFAKKSEVDAYSEFLFCDDVSEEYSQSLAGKAQIKYLKNYLIIPRIIRKIFRKKLNDKFKGLFWAYGTAAYLPKHKRIWYRLNIIIWEMLRYLLK